MDFDWRVARELSPRKFSAHSAIEAVVKPMSRGERGEPRGAPGVLVLGFVFCAALPVFSQTSILGFTPSDAAHQVEIENRFKAIPSADEERRQHHIFTAEPHVAGSARNNELARYIADEWRNEGLEDVIIRRYDVYGSNPKFTSLEMVAPVHYRAILREMPVPGDPDLKNKQISSAWSGMSASGEVTAPLVYAHSGNPEDYELLRKQGIDVKGKVVLVRSSNPYSYRGSKALTAEREGAAAILIYSDPAEDGYKKGKVVPNGPWGPEYHIQRGAITYDRMVAVDPLTPRWVTIPGAKRIPVEEAVSIPKIMALPLSWHDAKPLLSNMDGPVAPDDWQGGLPIKYHMGGTRVRVHVKIEMKFDAALLHHGQRAAIHQKKGFAHFARHTAQVPLLISSNHVSTNQLETIPKTRWARFRRGGCIPIRGAGPHPSLTARRNAARRFGPVAGSVTSQEDTGTNSNSGIRLFFFFFFFFFMFAVFLLVSVTYC